MTEARLVGAAWGKTLHCGLVGPGDCFLGRGASHFAANRESGTDAIRTHGLFQVIDFLILVLALALCKVDLSLE